MRIGGDPLRIRPFAQREQHDAPAAPDGGVGQRKRQAAAAANDGERGLAVLGVCGIRALMMRSVGIGAALR